MTNTLTAINNRILTDPADFIAEQERVYGDEIARVSEMIAADDDIKIVGLAGPSGAGKTTTAGILCQRLKDAGETVAVVSLDDFYLPTERLPKLPDNTLDTESVNALDTEMMRSCFDDIIKKGRASLPRYDFHTGRSIPDSHIVDIGQRGIVIVEGLHALNPVIGDLVPRKNIFKIYISVNSPVLNDDGGVLLTSRQIRLARRAIRDEQFRNSPINRTLTMWKGVVEGEEKYLYCFKPTADVCLKTLHLYEPCLYRDKIVKMAREVGDDVPCRDYFLRAAKAIEGFVPLDRKLIPENSLIREFIG